MQPNLLNILSSNNIIIFMLILTRITGLFQSAPFFSSIQAPLMTKVWFAGTISFIMYPLIKTSKFFIMPHDMVEFAILLSIEFLIGYLIGFVANLIIEATRMTGNILSIQTGLSMAEALDPATGVSSNEISKIYLNFSDPWPKLRHAKRRLTSKIFLNLYDKIFCDIPHIIQKTDNIELFAYSIESLSKYGYTIEKVSLDLKNEDIDNVCTEYEKKFMNMGVNINYLNAKKYN